MCLVGTATIKAAGLRGTLRQIRKGGSNNFGCLPQLLPRRVRLELHLLDVLTELPDLGSIDVLGSLECVTFCDTFGKLLLSRGSACLSGLAALLLLLKQDDTLLDPLLQAIGLSSDLVEFSTEAGYLLFSISDRRGICLELPSFLLGLGKPALSLLEL